MANGIIIMIKCKRPRKKKIDRPDVPLQPENRTPPRRNLPSRKTGLRLGTYRTYSTLLKLHTLLQYLGTYLGPPPPPPPTPTPPHLSSQSFFPFPFPDFVFPMRPTHRRRPSPATPPTATPFPSPPAFVCVCVMMTRMMMMMTDGWMDGCGGV